MKVGIIGAGNVGMGIGKRLSVRGHEVVISFARSPDKVSSAADLISYGAKAGTPEEAARHGQVVIIATPWAATLDAARAIAPQLDGKIVWDTTNPLKPDLSGLEIGSTSSGCEEVARAAPGVRVVKAMPPFAEVLHTQQWK